MYKKEKYKQEVLGHDSLIWQKSIAYLQMPYNYFQNCHSNLDTNVTIP